MIPRSRLLLAAMGIALSIAALAQAPAPSKDAAAPAAAEAAVDPLARNTPHDTVRNFIAAVEKEDLPRAAQYLDGRLDPDRKAALALQLKQLMDRRLKLDLNSLSRSPAGDTDDGLPLNRESLGEIEIGENTFEILLDRVQRGKNPPIWLFSAETILNLRKIPWEAPQVSWMERHAPAMLIENSLFGVALYRWIYIPLGLIVMALIAWMATALLTPPIQRFLRARSSWDAFLGGTSYLGPARLLVFALLMWLGAQFGDTLMMRQYWSHIALLLTAVAAAWLFMRVIGYVVVAPNYELSAPRHPSWPVNLEDVQAVVGWVRTHAGELGINPDHVAAIGESAGANLATLLGTDSGQIGSKLLGLPRRMKNGKNMRAATPPTLSTVPTT